MFSNRSCYTNTGKHSSTHSENWQHRQQRCIREG